jgi:hypothetical protein
VPREGGLKALPVRAAYRLGELARAASLSRWRMLRLLESSDVELVRVGRVIVVPLSELEMKVWPIWEAIKAAETLRHALEEV